MTQNYLIQSTYFISKSFLKSLTWALFRTINTIIVKLRLNLIRISRRVAKDSSYQLSVKSTKDRKYVLTLSAICQASGIEHSLVGRLGWIPLPATIALQELSLLSLYLIINGVRYYCLESGQFKFSILMLLRLILTRNFEVRYHLFQPFSRLILPIISGIGGRGALTIWLLNGIIL